MFSQKDVTSLRARFSYDNNQFDILLNVLN